MPYIRHESLFTLQELYELEQKDRFEAIFSAVDSYSRLIEKISKSDVLEQLREQIVKQALDEGFITDDTVAIDGTHIEARDQAPAKREAEQEKPEPKKRGRKSKEEREAWLKEKQEVEEQKPIYEKEIAAQLGESYATLRNEIPLPSSPTMGSEEKQRRKKRILVRI